MSEEQEPEAIREICRIPLPVPLDVGVEMLRAAERVCEERGIKGWFRNEPGYWVIYEKLVKGGEKNK